MYISYTLDNEHWDLWEQGLLCIFKGGMPLATGWPGHNEYGWPILRCFGFEHDEHVRAWIETQFTY